MRVCVWRRLGLGGLACMLAVVAATVPAYASVSDAKGWFEALDVPRRIFIVQMLFTVAGIAVTFFLVGRIWREALIVIALIAVQFSVMPKLLTKPGDCLRAMWREVETGRVKDETVYFVFVSTMIVLFGFALVMNVRMAKDDKMRSGLR